MEKIHGNCKKYKFKQSEPARIGCCTRNNLPLSPISIGCDNYEDMGK